MAADHAQTHVPEGTWLGHPRGLFTLALTELWERFSYYGMRALLVLFMTASIMESGGLGFGDATANAIYGLYTAGVYLLCLPGGWMADRLIGQQRAIWYGGIVIAMGHFTMALPLLGVWFGPFAAGTAHTLEYSSFFAGLVLIVLGTGLLKPNISAIVGGLYGDDHGARRDAGFTIFYMGINIGALLGPLVCGALGENVNWHYGFGAAGVGMLLGLFQFRKMQPFLGNVGTAPHQKTGAAQDARHTRRDWLVVILGVGTLLVLTVLGLAGVINFNAVELAESSAYVILALTVIFFGYIFLFGGLDAAEKKRVGVIVALCFGAVVFWSGFEQAGSSFNLFAERFTDRSLFGGFFAEGEHPASWYQSANPVFIVLLAPFFSWLWVFLARRNLEPSVPLKFALGMAQLALGFLVMFGAAALLVAKGNDNQVLPTWLLLTYLLHTTGELCLSPVGLSTVTKMAPQRYVSQMMGTWFMGTSLGNLLAGLLAGHLSARQGAEESIESMPDKFFNLVLFFAGCAVLFVVFNRLLKRWMRGGR